MSTHRFPANVYTPPGSPSEVVFIVRSYYDADVQVFVSEDDRRWVRHPDPHHLLVPLEESQGVN